MGIHIIQIDKARFVCGLFWQSLSRPRELQREAMELGRKIGSDLMVVRRDQSTAQAGYAQSSEGAARTLYSLGAAVSKTVAMEGAYYDGMLQPVHNWLAALQLPDGKWAYFAVRDANFLPNGDFAGSKEEVLERLYGDYALGGWNVVIGDESLAGQGFHNFNVRRIESLLPQRKDGSLRVYRWWRLRPIAAHSAPGWRLAAAVALAVGGGGVFLSWQHWQAKRQAEQALLAQRAAAPRPAPRPWAEQPLPSAAMHACFNRLDHLTPGGWRLDEFACMGGNYRYAWSRSAATVATLRAEVPQAVIDPGGEKATLAGPLAGLAPARGEDLLAAPQAVEPLMAQMQSLGLSMRLNKRALPALPAAPGAAAPDWQAFGFQLEAQGVAPQQLAAMLERPGVRLEKITYRGMAWLLEGVIYAK
ncbi:type 4b pilus protein PilO2 [Pseudoduganella violaceinigra]|uniref:type 4b pilus protein PilO2 n=1 Tax=Pseudoduganella violaceinigra TaxID=246602 RepID=UPI0004136E3C|nr:type 4b pilus protein PilO2 [Pseudoduganella violaceinigra]